MRIRVTKVTHQLVDFGVEATQYFFIEEVINSILESMYSNYTVLSCSRQNTCVILITRVDIVFILFHEMKSTRVIKITQQFWRVNQLLILQHVNASYHGMIFVFLNDPVNFHKKPKTTDQIFFFHNHNIVTIHPR